MPGIPIGQSSAGTPIGDGKLTGMKTATYGAGYVAASGTNIDWTAGSKQSLTLSATITLTFTSPGAVTNTQLQVIQGSPGGQIVTWPASVKWIGSAAPTLSTGAGAVDFVTFSFDGTTYWGTYGLNFG